MYNTNYKTKYSNTGMKNKVYLIQNTLIQFFGAINYNWGNNLSEN